MISAIFRPVKLACFLAIFLAQPFSAVLAADSQSESEYLAERMGVPERYTDAKLIELISLPVYSGASLVYNRYNGIEYDDQMASLPFAVLLTSDSIDTVRDFYNPILSKFDRHQFMASTIYFQEKVDALKDFPLNYRQNVYVELHPYPVGDREGTMIKISYMKVKV